MTETRRIPQKDSNFDQYIKNTDNHIAAGSPTTNGERLGMSPTEIAGWASFRGDWDIIYPKYTNPDTRTKTVKNNKNNVKDEFSDFAQPLLDRFAAHPELTENDRSVFNLPVSDSIRTPRGAISETPFVNLKPIGGGVLEVRSRTEADASRASRHPLADGVEVRFKLVVSGSGNFPTPEPGNQNQAGQNTPPLSAADCNDFMVSKKALFKLNVGAQHAGKTLYCFFRWVNLSNLANSGQWSGVMQVLVL